MFRPASTLEKFIAESAEGVVENGLFILGSASFSDVVNGTPPLVFARSFQLLLGMNWPKL
jgi:hypothetical protein